MVRSAVDEQNWHRSRGDMEFVLADGVAWCRGGVVSPRGWWDGSGWWCWEWRDVSDGTGCGGCA